MAREAQPKPERETNQTQQTTRRTVLRSAGVALASVGIIGTAKADPEGIPVSPGDIEDPVDVKEILTVSDEIKELTAQYPLLTLTGKSIRNYVRQGNLSGQERSEALQALAHVRSTFPTVKRKRNSGRHLEFQLAPSAQSSVTEEDQEQFDIAHEAFIKSVSGEAGPRQNNRQQSRTGHSSGSLGGGFAKMYAPSAFSLSGAMYTPRNHRRLTRTACVQMGMSDTDRDDLAVHSDDPDYIGSDVQTDNLVPDSIPHSESVEDILYEGLKDLFRYPTQYYDESASLEYHGHSLDLPTFGTMPKAGHNEMNKARNASSGSSEERKYLGRATHYVHDSAQPLHVGMGVEQLGIDWGCTTNGCYGSASPLFWLHEGSETLFKERWGVTQLKSNFKGDGDPYYYYDIVDEKQALRDLAGECSEYSYDMFHRIFDEGSSDPSDWYASTITTLDGYFDNCMTKCGLYTRGFLHQFY